MMTDARREDLRRRIGEIARYKDLKGATVLEIGADAQGTAAQALLDAGAVKVLSSNFGERWPVETAGAIERVRLDARDIAAQVADESIDLVFGIAVLEHIDGLAEFFAGAKRALKPGGLFFVQGAPIWSSSLGHHVGVIGEKGHYRFGVPGANPMEPWEHLAHTQASLAAALAARDVWPADAEKIADFVYNTKKLNRVGYRTMCEIFAASPLKLVDRIEGAFKAPPPAMLAAIERGPFGGQERYDVAGITFVAN